MKAIVLAGGYGDKIWPYNSCRNKTMVSIGNKPVLGHLVEALKETGIEQIIIAGSHFMQEIKCYFKNDSLVEIVELEKSYGNAFTLFKVKSYVSDDFLVFYGDCLFHRDDIKAFVKSEKGVLLSPLHQDAKDMICAEVKDNEVVQFWGHPRGDDWQYFAAGYCCPISIFDYLETIPDFFQTTKVGVGSPAERYIETAYNDMFKDGYQLTYMISNYQIFDIDKPWHIMEANQYYNQGMTATLHDQVGKGSQISSQAKLLGHVVLGDDSYIGDQVIIEGNVIVGNHTIIDNGAIIGKGVVIGDHCRIMNHCKIGDYCSIGDECIIDQTAELLGGVLFKKVYLYHYGEYYGVVGRNSDLGAGTTCGTLRFDDGETAHYIKGKKQIPKHFSNACFIGDYSRTGVGAILLPGCKIGCKSIVGSGVILNEDVEDETMIYAKQDLVKVPWGDEKYGW